MKKINKFLIIFGSGAFLAATIYAANCTTDVPAQCHYADTNYTSVCNWTYSSDSFSTKCVSTTNSSGGLTCDSITNKCVWQNWNHNCVFGDGAKENHTNNFDTTTSKGSCTGG